MTTLFEQTLKRRILLLDGGMGTYLQQQNLTEADFGGPDLDGCNEHLVLTRPDVILDVHRAYLKAGSDIISTNTFGSTPLVLAEYNLADQAELISKRAAELARHAVNEVATVAWPRFVAGAMGPTTKSLSVTGGATFEDLLESYYVQASGLIQGGVDVLLLETSQDLLNVKAASLGIMRAFDE
ncbi:MAG TPA: homocysteine S-methyltransferase family protein, partial [Candidatus Angelobacter sp.]|nr:homocysteine S-methyltransferase family protein [Candidatus Angelobacter sp.]